MSFSFGNFAMGSVSSAARFSGGMTRGRIQGGNMQGVNYPSPFFDVGHTYLPTTVKQLFKFCRYYFLTNPLINAIIVKLSEYPVTDIIIDHEDPEVVRKWTDYYNDTIRFRSFQIECGLDYHCFHGDVRAITEDGPKSLRELVGKTVRVLSQDGIYRAAEFKSYGRQELYEVEFSDGDTVLTTAEHEWVVTTRTATTRVRTLDLEGRKVLRTVAPRPEKDEEYYAGVRHGFTFGDGTLYNEGKQARANFFGAKDASLLPYFTRAGYRPIGPNERNITMVHGLPPEYKRLPSVSATASYWYGFLCGFLAADGSVDNTGCVVLTQASRVVLEYVRRQLPRIGMVGGALRGYYRESAFGAGDMYYVTLLKQYMLPEDFLLESHRTAFVSNQKDTASYRTVSVHAVRATGIEDEVFCCVEPVTHTFTIDNGILTGNCYGTSAVSLSFPFQKYLTCTSCGFSEQARKIRDYWSYSSHEFRLSCPRCGATGAAIPKDWYYRDASSIRPVRWNVEDIEVSYNDITGECTYFYTMPAPMRADITLGKKDIVEGMPQIFLQAIRQEKGVIFSKANLFTMKRATLAFQDRGWGIPLILPVLKDAFYLQIMKKAQEAILLEHIVPLRILFPQAASGTTDPFTTINLLDWRDQVAMEIARWRHDNNYIPIMPLPLGNQTIGGDGKALLMSQEMQMLGEQIIMGMGVPREFLQGGLSYAGTNVSMRMLENMFLSFIGRQRQMANWVMQMVAHFMGWPKVNVRFKPFKMADDMQRKSYLFQLNQANKISDTTLLSDADLNIEEENDIMMQEGARRLAAVKKQQIAMAEIQGEAQVVMMKMQAKAQQAMQQAMQQPTAPGEPGGPQAQMSPQEAQQQAQATPPPQPPMLPEGTEGGGSSSVPGDAQSTLGLDQDLGAAPGQEQMPVDILQLAEGYAAQIAQLDPSMQEMALNAIAAQSQELADLVYEALSKIQQGDAGQSLLVGGAQGGPETGGVDMRPLPDKLPPRRVNALV